MATRPWSFPASSMSVVTSAMFMGWVAASNGFHMDWLNAVLALVAMVFFQIGGDITFKKCVTIRSCNPVFRHTS